MRDGHSILFTAQLPNSVATWVMRGNFNGNVFEGFTRGRFNLSNYNWAVRSKIRFLRNEARIEGSDSVHKPPGFVHDPREDEVLVSHRILS